MPALAERPIAAPSPAKFAGPDVLDNWPPPSFIDYCLSKLPPPPNSRTGETTEGHLKLHGRQRDFLYDPYRDKGFFAGQRAGKSFDCALCIYVDLQWAKRRGQHNLIWTVVGPDYDQAQAEMEHLDWMLEKAGLAHTFRTPENASWRITFPDNDFLIWTRTSSQVNKLAGKAYRGAVVAEGAQHPEGLFQQLRGRIAENRGWIALNGTFEYEEGPHFGMLADEWETNNGPGAAYFCPSWENLAVFPGGRNDPEILRNERDMAPEEFMERYGGRPRQSSHLVMKYADRRHHVRSRFPDPSDFERNTSFDRDAPVVLWIDPGRAHATAVAAVQFDMNMCWIIDAVYRWGRTVPMIIEECARKPWAQNVHQLIFDPSSRQKRTEHADSVKDQWSKMWPDRVGGYPQIILPTVPLSEGYDVHHRALLNSWPQDEANARFNRDQAIRPELITNPFGPRLYIDPKAAPILFGGTVDGKPYAGEYKNHKNRVDRGGTIVKNEPVDTHNDMIKAINYGLFYRFSVRETAIPDGPYSMPYEMVL